MWRDQPAGEIQYDGVDHLSWHEPVAVPRCRYPQCKVCSRIKCEKCRLHYCLNKSKNCFTLATQNKYLWDWVVITVVTTKSIIAYLFLSHFWLLCNAYLVLSGCYNYYYITIIIIIIHIPHFTAVLLVLICTGLTNQALVIHCSAKNFLYQVSMTVLSITAFCIRI
jgi:hypothetical protein